MDNFPYQTPPRWWGPCPSRLYMRCAGLGRALWRRHREGIRGVEVQGHEAVRDALARGGRVVIVSNHATHSDPLVMIRAGERVGRHFYYMANWQTFHLLSWFGRRVLQRHGCFSVDREGADDRAYREAVRVVADTPHPLVVFAEGEVFHHYQRVAPFRLGAAFFAQAAAGQTERPVLCIPAAVTYRYDVRPVADLARLVGRMEQRLGLPPGPPALAARVRLVGEGVLRRREEQYLGGVRAGAYAARSDAVVAAILGPLEAARDLKAGKLEVPNRVARLRRLAIRDREAHAPPRGGVGDPARQLADLLVATQVYSSARDYDADTTTFEHVAEIVDKLEEDVLGAVSTGRRGVRRAYVRFGPAVPVTAAGPVSPRRLSAVLRDSVQAVLDDLIASCGPWDAEPWGGP